MKKIFKKSQPKPYAPNFSNARLLFFPREWRQSNGRFEEELLRHVHADHADLLAGIRDEKKLSDDNEAKLKDILDTFAKNFA